MRILAEFRSECWVCDGPIEVGDPIVNEDGWRHQKCGGGTSNPLCSSCFIMHAGPCG